MSTWRDEFREYCEAYKTRDKGPLETLKTHMSEIVRMFCEGSSDFITEQNTHFLADGMSLQFTFADGKRYEMIIREVRKK